MNGEKIYIKDNTNVVSDEPIILFIEGDGIGPDIWKAAKLVLDSAVKKAYKGKRIIHWKEILAGDKAYTTTRQWLPEKTIEELREYKVAIKGPLTTPVGGGIRSLNVSLRQILELFACVRPVRYIKGVPSPVKSPELVDIILFRENMEDVYAGIEWEEGSAEAKRLIEFLNRDMQQKVSIDSGIGIKPISIGNSKKLVRKAIEYAIQNNRESVTLVHKGNIMKYTEGAFKDWGYELARDEFPGETITEDELYSKFDGKKPVGKIIIKDRIADAMFQQILLRPAEYDVIATPNLNGDYLSDALAAQIGGLGMAPGANIGDEVALFEATHGTAPKYAGQDKVNPSSVILSGELMLRHLGWKEAADVIVSALEKTIAQKIVTYDLERQMEGATKVKCSEFGSAVAGNM